MAEEYQKDLDIRQRASLAQSGGLIDFILQNKYKAILWLVVTVAMITLWVTATETMAGIFLTIAQFLLGAAFMIVQFAALFLFLGRGRIYWVQPGETGVTFADYRGNDQILEVARRVVTILRGQSDVRQMGGTYTAGLLLEGPPGSGKSYLAQAMATEAGLPFAYASAPGFSNMFFGVGNLRVMMLYSKARKMAKKHGGAIVFIDEIDAIGMARSAQTSGQGSGTVGGLFGNPGNDDPERTPAADGPAQFRQRLAGPTAAPPRPEKRTRHAAAGADGRAQPTWPIPSTRRFCGRAVSTARSTSTSRTLTAARTSSPTTWQRSATSRCRWTGWPTTPSAIRRSGSNTWSTRR